MSKKSKIIINIFITICVVVGISIFHNYRIRAESLTANIQEIEDARKALEKSVIQTTIEYGDEYKISNIIEATKSQYSNINIKYVVDENDSELNTKILGNHIVNITYSKTDEYDQIATETSIFNLEVVDTQEPIIELISDNKTTIYEHQTFEPQSIVSKVFDKVDGELTKSDILKKGTYTITSNCQNGKVGNCTVIVEAMDKNGLIAKTEHEVEVLEKVYASNRVYLGNYTAILHYGNRQEDTDAPDSANYYPNSEGITVITDHNYQGFYNGMMNNNTGYAFGKPIHKVSTYYGTVREDLTDIDFDGGGSYQFNMDGDICMYTCIDNNGRRVITYWNYD